jgi:hypothetical protein
MRNLLLITYNYPPRHSIGALRPGALAKYLPDYEWRAMVLTPRVPGRGRTRQDVIETGYRDVLQDLKAKLGLNPKATLHDQLGLALAAKRDSKLGHTRAIEWLKHWVEYPDFARGWIPFATEAVNVLAAGTIVDAILTTSPPETAHVIGAYARALLRVPWIADFRDLWTQNVHSRMHTSRLLRIRQEKRVLKSTDALVTVSSPWADRLKKRYPSKPIYTITNGFDPADFESRPSELTDYFSITYAGQLYNGKRDPTPLFDVIRELIQEQILRPGEVRLRFYGPKEMWLPALIAQYGLREIVELNDIIPRNEVLRREMESQILLLLGWSDLSETGQHTGKLFEYLGAGRPILAVGGNRGVLSDVLQLTKAGIHALSRLEIRDCIMRMYREFRNCGRVEYQPDSEAVAQYSHPVMVRKFAEVLDEMVKADCRAKGRMQHLPGHGDLE